MLYKATKSFTGVIHMSVGEVKEISDTSLAEKLLKAGLVMEHEKPKKKPARKRKGK